MGCLGQKDKAHALTEKDVTIPPTFPALAHVSQYEGLTLMQLALLRQKELHLPLWKTG